MTLVELIKSKGYTIPEFAQLLNVATTQIYRWNKQGIITSNEHYPTLKELIPEIEGKKPKHLNKKKSKLKELQLTETDLEPPPEEIPFSSPFPTIKWNKPMK
jgi:transposase